MRHTLALSLSALAALLVQCKTPDGPSTLREAGRLDDGAAAQAQAAAIPPAGDLMGLPTLRPPSDYTALVEDVLGGVTYPADKKAQIVQRLSHYMGFLGLKPEVPSTKKVLSRILDGSTTYLFCDFSDWECLEQKPLVTPKKGSRVENAGDLGQPVLVNEPLRLQAWFTDAWDKAVESVETDKMLATRLAEKIRAEGQDAVAVAIYGIDETNGSMKQVYDAIVEKHQAGVDVRAVLDTENYTKGLTTYPLTYSYIKPATGTWVFDAANAKHTNIAFQYKDTLRLMNALNGGIQNDQQARARIAWPNRGIMHNKFVVFTKGGQRSVWSGTANVADTCMGTERNTNVGLFIDNTAVANTFLAEFEEMFAYQPELYKAPGKLKAPDGSEGVPVGRFHNDKTPNTKRYFRFQSGEDLRVHFAPTDDGEHRVILPWLLSARPGDVVRVSMFGGAGIEIVRAFQYAASRGVEVRIVFDKLTGSQLTGWLRDAKGTVLDLNPYAAQPTGKVTVRRSTWRKQNHHKSATLTRKTASGTTAESIIIGSQNWSTVGNDQNDENMVTIRSRTGALALANQFNDYFDSRLWPVSQAGEMKYGIPYKVQVGQEPPADTGVTPGADPEPEGLDPAADPDLPPAAAPAP